MSAPGLEPSSIHWASYRDYEAAKERARKDAKPLLLDLFAISCASCLALEEHVYADPDVIHAINEFTVPVRLETDHANLNAERSRIIGRHLSICSPTIQLLSCEGVAIHEFHEAPRHTRLDHGHSGVHYDVPGTLTPASFLSQFALGMGKFHLHRECPMAIDVLGALGTSSPDGTLVGAEALSLLRTLHEDAGEFPARAANGVMGPLAHAVAQCCDALIVVPDSALSSDWRHPPGDDERRHRGGSLRDAVIAVYRRLGALGVAIDKARAKEATNLHSLLRQHQRGFREFHGLMLGVPQKLIDLHLLPGKRTIRSHIAHAALAEYWAQLPARPEPFAAFQALSVQERMPGVLDPAGAAGPIPASFGSLAELLERHERVHRSLVNGLLASPDEMLAMPGTDHFQPQGVGFRLVRLGWALRDHRMDIEALLQSARHLRTEAASLARSLYSALGSVEGALIGAEDRFDRLVEPAIDFIRDRTPV